MPSGKKITSPIAKLIVNLRDNEGWSFERIGLHVGHSKDVVWRSYARSKNPQPKEKMGRPRKSTER